MKPLVYIVLAIMLMVATIFGYMAYSLYGNPCEEVMQADGTVGYVCI